MLASEIAEMSCSQIQNLSAFASLKKIFGTHVRKFGFCHL